MSSIVDNNIFLDMPIEITSVDEEIKEFLIRILQGHTILGGKKSPTLNLFIDSTGSDLYESLSFVTLLEAIKQSGIVLRTFSFNEASSGSLLWLACGTERYVLPHTTALLHSPNCNVVDTPLYQVKANTGVTEVQMGMYNTWLYQFSNLSFKQINDLESLETVLISNQLLEYGMVDEVLTAERLNSVLKS